MARYIFLGIRFSYLVLDSHFLQLRGSGNRTRGEILGLNKRNGQRNSSNPPNTPGERPMTMPRSAMKISAKQSRTAPPVTEGFSQQEIFDLKECFRLFDLEGTGRISVGSYRAVLESLLENDQQSYPHLDEILRLLSGRSDDEMLDFDAYLSLMASTSLQRRLLSGEDADDQPNFQHVFDLFDVDRKGYITVEDLRHIALELGENDMTMDELQEMIDRARSKKTGQVTLKEFSKIMTLNLFQKMEDTAVYDNETLRLEN